MIGTRKYLVDASVYMRSLEGIDLGFGCLLVGSAVKSGGIKITSAAYVGGNSTGIEE